MAITISKIDDKMSVYRRNKIILWKLTPDTDYCIDILRSLTGVSADYIADDEYSQSEHRKIPLIDEGQMWKMAETKDVMIQITSAPCDLELKDVVERQGNGIVYVSWAEFFERTLWLGKYKLFQQQKGIKNIYINSEIYCRQNPVDKIPFWDYLARNTYEGARPVFLCLPPKTGDYTLEASFLRAGIDVCNLWHSARALTREVWKLLEQTKRPIRIITAVRNPLSQNISGFFQLLSCFYERPEYWENGGDVQKCFDLFLECETKRKYKIFGKYLSKTCREMTAYMKLREKENIDYLIQDFFENQFEPYTGIDVYKHPFDKRGGSTIIKEDGKEVFIFQLEKLNEVRPKLCEFIGKDFVLLNKNEGNKKWYAKAYESAKKNLIINEDYKTEAENCRLMKHFYG